MRLSIEQFTTSIRTWRATNVGTTADHLEKSVKHASNLAKHASNLVKHAS